MLFKNICNDKIKKNIEITILIICIKSDKDLKWFFIFSAKLALSKNIAQMPIAIYIKFTLLPTKSPKLYIECNIKGVKFEFLKYIKNRKNVASDIIIYVDILKILICFLVIIYVYTNILYNILKNIKPYLYFLKKYDRIDISGPIV